MNGTAAPLSRVRTRRRGRFIVLEGIDGAGTTTQAAALRAALLARGERAEVTCEPSLGPIGMLLRQALAGRLVGRQGRRAAPLDANALALLFAADRADHVRELIRPRLRAGVTVLCDRYVLSSVAYQGLELDLEYVEAINQHAPPPDLTLFLDVPPRQAQKRRLADRAGEELFDALKIQQRVDRNYRQAIAHRKERERIEVVDGARPVAEVTRALLARLDALGSSAAG